MTEPARFYALRDTAVLAFRGPEAAHFLQGQLSCDTGQLSATRMQLAGLHNPRVESSPCYAYSSANLARFWRCSPRRWRCRCPSSCAAMCCAPRCRSWKQAASSSYSGLRLRRAKRPPRRSAERRSFRRRRARAPTHCYPPAWRSIRACAGESAGLGAAGTRRRHSARGDCHFRTIRGADAKSRSAARDLLH